MKINGTHFVRVACIPGRERERVWIWNRFEDCNMSNVLTSLHISFCCHTNSLLDLIRFKEENFEILNKLYYKL